MTGKIIKGIAGFYYIYISSADENVCTPYEGVYECKAKGIFRNEGVKPLVGDNVEIEILDEANKKGNIVKILERKNSLIRPAVANVDQALVIFAAAKPTPNLNLLDRFLISMEMSKVESIICFNKTDVADEDYVNHLRDIYFSCGYKVICTSTVDGSGVEQLKSMLKGKTTVLAGPSGVGKSSMTNAIIPEACMQTGGISKKIERGKHTTRHSELFTIQKDTFLFDTPGFSSLYVNNLEKEELMWYFPEFDKFNDKCRFQGCVHINEPDCAVKDALREGLISKSRYDNYLLIYDELKNKKKY